MRFGGLQFEPGLASGYAGADAGKKNDDDNARTITKT